MDVKDITIDQYLEAKYRAQLNGADKPEFRRINEELRALSETRERLAFEFLAAGEKILKRNHDAEPQLDAALLFSEAISAANRPK